MEIKGQRLLCIEMDSEAGVNPRKKNKSWEKPNQKIKLTQGVKYIIAGQCWQCMEFGHFKKNCHLLKK